MLMAMLMALQALSRSGVTYLSYRSSVIKANIKSVNIAWNNSFRISGII